MKKFITLAAVAAVVLAACSKEQPEKEQPEEEQPEEVKIIRPNGLVILSVPEQIVAGDTAAIRLRVNPSTARLTAENLSIDCLESMIYDAEYSEAEQKYCGIATKSADSAEDAAIPYVQNTDSYSICSVVPDSLDHKPLEGQYIVTVKAQDTKNIIDRSTLALVCKFEDENSDTAYISTEIFSLPQIPRPGDAIFAWSPQSMSLRAGSLTQKKDSIVVANDTVNSAKWYLSARSYKNAASGATIRYDYSKYITDVKVQLYSGSDEIACNLKKTDFDGVYSSMIDEMCAGYPDIAQEPFKTLYESGSDKKYETYTNTLTVTDKYGHADRWSQDLNIVIPTSISFKLNIPEEVPSGKYDVVDKEATYAEYGIDIETIKRYPSLNLVALSYSNMGGTGISFAGRRRDDNFGLGGVTVAAGRKSISADLLCSRVFGMFYVKGPGPTNSGSLVNNLNFIERFVPAE